MEVHFFTEYHGSTEQVYAKIAKGCEEESTINDDTLHRSGHNIHAVVNFTAETDSSGKEKEFLSRDTTKQRVITVISDELRERECHVVNEQVWSCVFGNSKDGCGDISTRDCAQWTSFIY